MAKSKWKSKIDKHVAAGGTVGLASWKAGLFGNASKDEVIAYANKKGYTLGQAWQDKAGGKDEQKIKTKDKGLGGQIKSYGSNGNLSDKEVKKIQSSTGTSINKIIQKLDQINQQLKAKDKTQIGLGAAASNRIIEAGLDPLGRLSNFGEGKIGQELVARMGREPYRVGRMTQPGKEPNLLIGGTQLGPSGKMRVKAQKPKTPSGVNISNKVDADTDFSPEQEDFDFNEYLNSLMQNFGGEETITPEMPSMEMFEPISSNVGMPGPSQDPGPLSFASLGQSYLSDAIRSAFRNPQRARDYLRGGMNQMTLPSTALLRIGGQLGGFM